jgi:hypothetical protein
MSELTPGPILHRFLAGELDEAEAVRALLQLDPHKYPGLVMGGVTPEQGARLHHLSQVLGWEATKRLAPATTPDVPYGSPEYHAFIASIPRVTLEDNEPQ